MCYTEGLEEVSSLYPLNIFQKDGEDKEGGQGAAREGGIVICII